VGFDAEHRTLVSLQGFFLHLRHPTRPPVTNADAPFAAGASERDSRQSG
jgi:hypothetical protein